MGNGPLKGVRVVELAGIGPGPFAAMALADLGADVLRVDRPGGGLAFGDPALDLANRGKKSVAVDMKNPEGVDTVLRLVEKADVLIEGFRPGVAERLGVGPEVCHERNPRLVYGRMTGWGQDGPLATSAGHDIGYIAITGVLGAIGSADGKPQIPLNLLGDFAGGSMYLVTGVLAALVERQQSGQGQVVDAAIVDGAAHLLTMAHAMLASGMWQDKRGVNLLDGGTPFYDVYETSDGGWMAVGALEPQFYDELLRVLELDGEEIPNRYDQSQWPALRDLFRERFAERSRDEWAKAFEGTDACVAPILSLTEAAGHPHLAARETFLPFGESGVQPAPAPRLDRTPGEISGPPSTPGRDTREALAAWGFTDIDELLATKAVVQA